MLLKKYTKQRRKSVFHQLGGYKRERSLDDGKVPEDPRQFRASATPIGYFS
jgi:hypothetical protein